MVGYFIDFIKTKYFELHTDGGAGGGLSEEEERGERREEGGGRREETPPHSLEHLWLSAHRAYSPSQ